MRKLVSRTLALAAAGSIALGAGAGVADAAEAPGPAVWLIPGVDLGSVLDPAVGLPTAALAPVDGLLTYLAG